MTITAPWAGWVPDLPPHVIGLHGFRATGGFVPIPHQSRGLFLRNDDGYVRIDENRLFGGSAAIFPGRAVTGLWQFVDEQVPAVLHRMAIVAGNSGAATDMTMFRLTGTPPQWVAVTPEAQFLATGRVPESDRDLIWDHAVFRFGCPTRTDQAGAAANIPRPVTVLGGSNLGFPTGVVMVTPTDAAFPANFLFDELQGNPAITPAPAFGATTVESFDGRMHFGATIEGGTRYLMRHRWSRVGNAFPDAAQIGSGYLDFSGEFSRPIMRIEELGDKLAVYFQEGVAFQVPTGRVSDAYRPQIVSKSRGLIGTRALCAISPWHHFGIFNDGWYFINSAGAWDQRGTLVLEETRGKSHELTKWKDTFYNDIDMNYAHRTSCVYDRFRKIVRISYTPAGGVSDDNIRILNYHIPTDSVWQDRYTTPVVSWGEYDYETAGGSTWDAYPGTWDSSTDSWDDSAPLVVHNCIVHGDTAGLVFNKDYTLPTYDGVAPNCYLTTHDYSHNADPLSRQTFHSLGVEYMNVGGGAFGIVVGSKELTHLQAASVPSNEGAYATIQTSFAHFRMSGTDHLFYIGAGAPVAIRSIIPELQLFTHDDTAGQV
jgi:hypothetical protein